MAWVSRKMSPQQKVDYFFSSIPIDEALRLLEFFKSKYAQPLREEMDRRAAVKKKSPKPDFNDKKTILTKAIGK